MSCTIQLASQLSGLSPHVIRIWERRYGALNPSRTCTNRRMYCEEAIERLKLLRELTENGHRIGNVARLSTEDLRAQVGALRQRSAVVASATSSTVPATGTFSVDATTPLETPQEFVQAGIAAARAYDSDRLRRLLHRARQQFGHRAMLHQVVCPLIHDIGTAWQQGNLRPSHEHVATAVIRELLLTPVPGSQTAPTAPEIVISTPVGEMHELGALLVSSSARDLGWRVTYLGPNLPTEEIAACARARQARAVGLSVVYPEGCPVIQEKLRKLRQLLPEPMVLIVGGRAAQGYARNLQDVNIQWADSLNSLDQILVRVSSSTGH